MRDSSRALACWSIAALAAALIGAHQEIANGNFHHLAELLTDKCGSLPHVVAGVAAGLLVLLPVLAIVSLLIAIATVIAGTRNVHRLTKRALPASGKVLAASTQAGCQAPVLVVASSMPLAFTYGIRRPKVVVSTASVDQLSGDELAAVIAHEAHHARSRDPLRRSLLAITASALWMFPVIGGAARQRAAELEIAADASAARVVSRGALASALMKFLAQPPATLGTTSIAGEGQIEQRVAALTGQVDPVPGATLLERSQTFAMLAAVGILMLIGATVPPMH